MRVQCGASASLGNGAARPRGAQRSPIGMGSCARVHPRESVRAHTCHAYRPADGALEGSNDTDLIDPARTKKRLFVLWVASGETICTVGPSKAVGLGRLYCGSRPDYNSLLLPAWMSPRAHVKAASFSSVQTERGCTPQRGYGPPSLKTK